MAFQNNEKCLSIFQKGVNLLAEFWPETKNTSSVIRPLVWGSRKAPFRRTMAVQQARMAKLYGRAKAGQGAQKQRHGAFKLWQGVHTCPQWFALFLCTILGAFKPAIKQFCSAAKTWLSTKSFDWQWMPWYTELQVQLESLSRANSSRSIFLTCSSKTPLVEKEHDKPTCFDFAKAWRDRRVSSATKTFKVSMREKPKRNPNGLGNNSGIFGCARSQRNPSISCKASHPLVYHPKRGETQIDHRLQRNKSISSTQTLQTGKLGRNISLSTKRHVGSKYRSQTCLFSFGHSRRAEAIHLHSAGKQSIPVPSSMLWHEHPAGGLAKCNESLPEKVEKGRHTYLDLSGRHFSRGQLPPSSAKTFGHHAARLGTFRYGDQQNEIATGSHPASGTFGFSGGPQKWNFASAKRKIECHSKNSWATF